MTLDQGNDTSFGHKQFLCEVTSRTINVYRSKEHCFCEFNLILHTIKLSLLWQIKAGSCFPIKIFSFILRKISLSLAYQDHKEQTFPAMVISKFLPFLRYKGKTFKGSRSLNSWDQPPFYSIKRNPLIFCKTFLLDLISNFSNKKVTEQNSLQNIDFDFVFLLM